MKNMLGLSGVEITLITVASLIVIAIVLFCVLVPIKEYFKCLISHAHLSAGKLRSLKMRDLPYKLITEWYIYAKKAGINLTCDDLEVHYSTGGNLKNVVNGLVYSKDACVELSFDTAKTLDLQGRDIKEILEDCIKVRQIESGVFKTVSLDNKEILVNVALSIRTNLNKLVGGVREDTLLSRIKESFICSVAEEESKDAIKNVDVYCQKIKAKDIDNDSLFNIIDINVISVELGRDYEYEKTLQNEEHEQRMASIILDKDRAQKELEEQQLKNDVQEELLKKAKLESQMTSEAVQMVQENKMSVVDYFKIQNVIADTQMRKSILGTLKKDEK